MLLIFNNRYNQLQHVHSVHAQLAEILADRESTDPTFTRAKL